MDEKQNSRQPAARIPEGGDVLPRQTSDMVPGFQRHAATPVIEFDKAAAHATLNRMARQNLRWIAASLLVIYLAVLGGRLLRGADLASPSALLPAITAVLFGVQAVLYWYWQPPLRWVHPLTTGMLALALLNILYNLYTTEDFAFNTNLLLLLAGSAFCLYLWPWHSLMVVLIGVGWLGTLILADLPSTDALEHGFHLGVVGTVAVVIQAVRYHTLMNLTRLRQADQEQRISLQDAIQRAQRSEDRLKMFSEATSEGIVMHANGVIIDANPRLLAMFGYELPEVLGRSVLDFLEPAARPAAEFNMIAQVEKPYESTGARKDGTLIPIEIRARTAHYQGKDVRLGVIRDISAYRRTEQALESVLFRTEVLYQVSQALLTVHDLPQVMQVITDSAEAVLNTSRVALIMLDVAERRVTHIVHSGTKADHIIDVDFDELMEGLTGWVLRECKPAFSPGGEPDDRESPAVQRRRKETNCGDIIVVPLTCQGEIAGTLTAIADADDSGFNPQDMEMLTVLANQASAALDNARLVASLRTSEAKFSKTFSASPVPMFITHLDDGRFLDVNDSFLRVVEYERADIINHTADELDLWVMADQLNPVLFTSNGLRDYEVTFRKRSGSTGILLMSTELIVFGTTPALLCIARDITTRKRFEAEREVLITELDAFSYTVAHDLKNPLALMLGYAEVLRTERDISDDVQFYAEQISNGAQKMHSIIDELLLLARLRHGKAVETEPLDMAQIVDETCDRLINLIDKYQPEIVFPTGWPAATGYAPWVEEVWVNYMSNALKYGGRPPRIELGAQPAADGMIRFWVRDNGPGLTDEQLAELFKPFTQLKQVVVGGGHGLGLSIVQRIIERLGGQVGVESVLGQGSTFYFTLPAA